MADLTPEFLDKLKRLAEAAENEFDGDGKWISEEDDEFNLSVGLRRYPAIVASVFRRTIAHYIAAMDPATALKLIEEVERLRDGIKSVNTQVNHRRSNNITLVDEQFVNWIQSRLQQALKEADDESRGGI